MAVNKVIYGNRTVIDISDTTAEAIDVRRGKDFYLRDGTKVSGVLGDVEIKDVNFFDYDGTLLYSYTASEFLALTEMPSNPTHDGLVSQGWNWTLSDAKTYISNMEKVNIGQMYTTDNGRTRVYVNILDSIISPYIALAVNGTVKVYWGDGTSTTITGTSETTRKLTKHTYSSAGEYVIEIDCTSGTFSIISSGSTVNAGGIITANSTTATVTRTYSNAVRRIELGDNITRIGVHAFAYCQSMESITIPNTVVEFGNRLFRNCFSLKYVTVPNSITNIPEYAFYSCYSLHRLSLPRLATFDDYVFGADYTLQSVTLPSNVKTLGTNTFYNARTLAEIVIPSSVTNISAGAFTECYCLNKIKFIGSTPPTVADKSAFTSVPTSCIIYVPKGSLSKYTSATNYPSSSTYTYVEF